MKKKLRTIVSSLAKNKNRTAAENILKNCKKYFVETLPYSTDTLISLDDAAEAVENYLNKKLKL